MTDSPICGAGHDVVQRQIGLMRDLTWGNKTCAKCIQLAYAGDRAALEPVKRIL